MRNMEHHMPNVVSVILVVSRWKKKAGINASWRLGSAETRVEFLQEENAALREKLEKLSQENDTLNRRYDTCSKAALFSSVVAACAQQYTTLHTQSLQHQLLTEQRQHSTNNIQIEKLKTKNKDLEEEVNRLQNDQEQHLKLEREVYKGKAQNESLKRVISKYQKDLEQNSKLKIHIHKLEADNQNLQRNNVKLKHDREEVMRQCSIQQHDFTSFLERYIACHGQTAITNTQGETKQRLVQQDPQTGTEYMSFSENSSDAEFLSVDETLSMDPSVGDITVPKEFNPCSHQFKSSAVRGIHPGRQGKEYTHSPQSSEDNWNQWGEQAETPKT